MRTIIATLLATGLLAAAGCGGDDEDSSSSSSGSGAGATQADTGSAPAESSGGGTKVSLTEFKITPKDGTAKAGKATFDVSNDGQVPHALEIEGKGVEEETDVLQGGDKATLEVDLKPGEYEWYCPVGNHRQQGMEGKLTVK
jgi:uncharacterized cupredoxin-like copper-binding protein